MSKDLGIKYSKKTEFSEWYSDVVIKSGLADYAPIKGCMVIKPYGFAIWEMIMKILDNSFKNTGVKNAYFPLMIPEEFLKRESEHFEGFVPEVAWIEEDNIKYAIRPTSETIIYYFFSKWIRSWRDLPIRINQWCNIVRWETKATKLFLRTREFLWQEGHTAHTTRNDAEKEVELRAMQYKDLIENYLAIPVIMGKRPKSDTFAGAEYTIAVESIMPDGRALQLGTSHMLAQNFARAFDITFSDKDGNINFAWQTSWGVSTRLIGAIVMIHGDKNGLILPPKIAPVQIVIVPIYKKSNVNIVIDFCKDVKNTLKGFRTIIDERNNYTPGWKFNDWELKGVPIRLEIGEKEVHKKEITIFRRDTKNRFVVSFNNLKEKIEEILNIIQKNLFEKAKRDMSNKIVCVKTIEELKKAIENAKFCKAPFCLSADCEETIKDLAVSIRIVFNGEGKCIVCGNKTNKFAYIGKSY